jgi:hypothetical protein
MRAGRNLGLVIAAGFLISILVAGTSPGVPAGCTILGTPGRDHLFGTDGSDV